MHGVTNPHRPKLAEHLQVAGAALGQAPHLLRYFWRGRRVRPPR